MNLVLKPFSDEESKVDYVINQFKESDEQEVAFLSTVEFKKINRAKKYRFGIKIKDDYFWFFNGQFTANDRKTAIRAYNSLIEYSVVNNLNGTVFINKK